MRCSHAESSRAHWLYCSLSFGPSTDTLTDQRIGGGAGGIGNLPSARRAIRREATTPCVRANLHPIRLAPVGGLENTVSDCALAVALTASVPNWTPPTTAILLHELRLWGVRTEFDETTVRTPHTGRWLVETLLDDALCRRRTRQGRGSHLLESPYGIHVTARGSHESDDGLGEAHHGQLLKVLSERGVPTSEPVKAALDRAGTVGDVLNDGILRTTYERELEFIAVAAALYIPPGTIWENEFGERGSHDWLLEGLLRRDFGSGTCFGTHALYAVAIMLRANDVAGFLEEKTRVRAEQQLNRAAKVLNDLAENGVAWDNTWAGNPDGSLGYRDPALDSINIIGHHLEWIAMAPSHLRPAPDVVASAVEMLCHHLTRLGPMQTRSFKSDLPCSHAARALCLLRRVDPYEHWRSLSQARTVEVGWESLRDGGGS